MPKKFQGQKAVIELTGGSLPADPVGVLQSVTITPDRETEELRGAGDTRFVDVMETARHFDISAEVMSWDLEAWDRTIEWDEAQSKTDSSADVERFTITVTLKTSDGSTKDIEFADAYFTEMPELAAEQDSYVGLPIELRAPDVTGITNTDAAA
jgi:hypothetical protein